VDSSYFPVQLGLNIKNEETQRLAHELAKFTGESMTAAVRESVRERLERIRRERSVSLANRLLAIGKDCAEAQARIARAAYRDLREGKWALLSTGLRRRDESDRESPTPTPVSRLP
jgi:antitoxin VapB